MPLVIWCKYWGVWRSNTFTGNGFVTSKMLQGKFCSVFDKQQRHTNTCKQNPERTSVSHWISMCTDACVERFSIGYHHTSAAIAASCKRIDILTYNIIVPKRDAKTLVPVTNNRVTQLKNPTPTSLSRCVSMRVAAGAFAECVNAAMASWENCDCFFTLAVSADFALQLTDLSDGFSSVRSWSSMVSATAFYSHP